MIISHVFPVPTCFLSRKITFQAQIFPIVEWEDLGSYIDKRGEKCFIASGVCVCHATISKKDGGRYGGGPD